MTNTIEIWIRLPQMQLMIMKQQITTWGYLNNFKNLNNKYLKMKINIILFIKQQVV